MCKAGLARDLVFRADVVPEIGGDDRGLAVFMNDYPQPVVERELLERNVEIVICLWLTPHLAR